MSNIAKASLIRKWLTQGETCSICKREIPKGEDYRLIPSEEPFTEDTVFCKNHDEMRKELEG
jgi:hypothetical protein